MSSVVGFNTGSMVPLVTNSPSISILYCSIAVAALVVELMPSPPQLCDVKVDRRNLLLEARCRSSAVLLCYTHHQVAGARQVDSTHIREPRVLQPASIVLLTISGAGLRADEHVERKQHRV